MEPSPEVLALFDVRLVAPLGGRINRHWLVEAQRVQLVLRCWGQSPLIDSASSHTASISYEVRLIKALAVLGWPVAPLVTGPAEIAGQWWSLAPFLSGAPPASDGNVHGGRSEQRARGHLLAGLHAGMAQVPDMGQRPGWRRCEEILDDPALDTVLAQNERERPEEVRILRWHLEQARGQVAGLALQERPGIIVHGDWTPWNLRFAEGRLSGILDFELAHSDHRVGDFVLSWRGMYDDIILGYAEVSPLEPEEWALLTPLWWAQLISLACLDMKAGAKDNGWIISKLLLRSPLMGKHAAEYQG
jgi:aminoglycoside phosphotransferase (APT) family kinase protein